METQQEYYYTYYSYEEWGRGYIGSRGCKCLPEEDIRYFGSFTDKTFKPTQKIIIKSDYASREEAYADEIILQEYYKVVENLHFANKAYQTSTKFCLSKEQQIELGKIFYDLKIGIHALTSEEKSEAGKIGGKIGGKMGGKIGGNYSYKNKIGIHALTSEEKSEAGRIGGKISGKLAYEMRIGIHNLTPEQRTTNGKKGGEISGKNNKDNKIGIFSRNALQHSEDSRKGGLKNKENGIGIHAQTYEEQSERGRKTASQKWECLETGFVTNAGCLSRYQKARGIDTSKRLRLS